MSTERGIPFGMDWGAVNQLEARRLARDPDTGPLFVRVFFASLGWANQIGHAEFATQGLANVLITAKITGEISIPSGSQVDAAIRRAKQAGLITDESSRRCLVPSPELWHKAGGKGSRSCSWHRIKVRR